MNLSSNGNNSLRTIDINLEFFPNGKGFYLPRPQQTLEGKTEQQKARQVVSGRSDTSVQLNYEEVRKGLQNALSRVEILCDNNAEGRRQLLQHELLRLFLSASEETRGRLGFVLSDAPLSYRVLEVLYLRRRQLCTGFEYALSDLKCWLSLAVLLDEPDFIQFMMQYVQELGPCSRQRLEDVMFVHESSAKSLCHAVLDISAPGDGAVPFDFRYYNFMLDDLIAMGDEPPHASLIPSVQREVTLSMRELHAEWLLQVTMALNLKLETFFLAVAIVDRYLAKVAVKRERFHLVGCAALMLASKQEEIFPASLHALVRYGADHFTIDMLVATECQLFAQLGFNVVLPTLSAVGMGILLQQDIAPCGAQRSCLLYVLATLAIRTYYRQYKLSSLAAAAVYMSRVCFNIPTGRPCEEVLSLLPVIRAALSRNPAVGSGGVHDVFSRGIYHEVSKLKLSELIGNEDCEGN
ncbi:mitotic cyclin, putative [Trypanosoma cruzi marinkellei]|uniref:Mitotic cyclin, putative n=1 Tax=Trypanosoma cruzi marinkellei TaxID=85056 RepID=K2PCC4_TRYCR|nr:mitotic cyclin, putative [Trypanosoma cruzi marinkellei]